MFHHLLFTKLFMQPMKEGRELAPCRHPSLIVIGSGADIFMKPEPLCADDDLLIPRPLFVSAFLQLPYNRIKMPRDPLIGLVGKPSAGKSSTLNSLTDATSKVGG